MRHFLASAALVLALPAVAHATPPTCDASAFEACGGSPSGSWNYSDVTCFTPPPMPPLFPDCGAQVTTSVDDVQVSGTHEFGSNNTAGTYTANMNATIVMSITAPMSCAQQCVAPPGAPATATQQGDQCVIQLTMANADEAAGTWMAVGSDLNVHGEDDPEPQTYQFCQQGDALNIHMVNGPMALRVALTRQ